MYINEKDSKSQKRIEESFIIYLLKRIYPFIILGIIYYFIVTITKAYIPCPFRYFFAYKCPGCGITSSIMSMSKLDIKSAFYYNPFVFSTFPFIIFQILFSLWLSYKKENMPMWNKILLIIYCILLIIWGVLRNIFL